jgi:hypothetical protein
MPEPHDERSDYDDEPWRRPRTPEQMIRLPRLALEWCGFLFVLLALGGAAMFIVFFLIFDPDRDPERIDNLLICIGFTVANALWAAGLFHGARRIGGWQSYRSAVLASSLAILPLPCPWVVVLTAPVGVWILVVLLRADVRAKFAEVRRNHRGG